MNDDMVAEIPGEFLARASAALPDAASASKEPHYAEVRLEDGRRVVITFKRFFYKRHKTSRCL